MFVINQVKTSGSMLALGDNKLFLRVKNRCAMMVSNKILLPTFKGKIRPGPSNLYLSVKRVYMNGQCPAIKLLFPF